MTLRTLTKCQEAKLSLVYFEVDETYSIVETRKLQTTIPGALKEQGSKVKVKSGRDVFEAEIVELNGKYTLRNVTDGDKNLRDYDASDVTLSVYPHRASLKNMPDHGGNRTYDLWNTSSEIMPRQMNIISNDWR
jgi:hypothetical protein